MLAEFLGTVRLDGLARDDGGRGHGQAPEELGAGPGEADAEGEGIDGLQPLDGGVVVGGCVDGGGVEVVEPDDASAQHPPGAGANAGIGEALEAVHDVVRADRARGGFPEAGVGAEGDARAEVEGEDEAVVGDVGKTLGKTAPEAVGTGLVVVFEEGLVNEGDGAAGADALGQDGIEGGDALDGAPQGGGLRGSPRLAGASHRHRRERGGDEETEKDGGGLHGRDAAVYTEFPRNARTIWRPNPAAVAGKRWRGRRGRKKAAPCPRNADTAPEGRAGD